MLSSLSPVAPAEALLPALLNLSVSGVVCYTPVLDEAGQVVDLAFAYVNPAAQRLLGLPAQPTATYLQQFPEACTSGAFSFHREAFETGGPSQFDLHYRAGSIDNRFQMAAQRLGSSLLVSFAVSEAHGRQAAEQALRESQARQQVQDLNAQLAAANQALYASNEELLLNQEEVLRIQEQLENRVRARTQQLALHSARLARLIQEAPAAICVLDGPALVFELLNPEYQALFPDRVLLGRPVLEALPELAGGPVADMLQGVYETGVTFAGREVPMCFARPGGGPLEERYFDFIYQARYDEQSHVNGLIVFGFEVTEQRQSRQEREVQQQEIQRLFEQAPVAVAILRGPELRVELANAAVSAIWGRPAAQTLGRPYFEAVPETAGQGFEEILAGVLATGQPFFITEAPVQLHRAHAGRATQGYVNFGFHPLFDEQRRTTGLMAIGTEVTDQVQARQQVQALNEALAASNQELLATNEALHQTNAQLTRTNADLDTFVYAASHDLKAPITNIEGLLDALRDYLPADGPEPMVPRLLGMMQSSIARFQLTVGHLTDISRLQQEPAEPTEAVVLAEVVEGVRLDLASLLESSRTQLLIDVNQCPRLRVPVKTLRSIVFNLLSNAVKYRAPERAPLVQVRTTCSATHVLLEVQDNGLGLSEQQQGRLFAMFRRLHDHVEGSGVGLYMVRRIVEHVGGTVSVQSQPGVGSTFTISLARSLCAT